MKTLESVLDTTVSKADLTVVLSNCVDSIKKEIGGSDKVFVKNDKIYLEVHSLCPDVFVNHQQIHEICVEEYCYFDNAGIVDGDHNFPKDIYMVDDDDNNYLTFDDIKSLKNINIHANKNSTIAFNIDKLDKVNIEGAFTVSIEGERVDQAMKVKGNTRILHVMLPSSHTSKDPQRDINNILQLIPKSAIKYEELHLSIDEYTYAIRKDDKLPLFYVLVDDEAEVGEYTVGGYHIYRFDAIEYVS